MPRPLKPRDPETGEMLEADLGPEANGAKPTKHGPERIAISVRLAQERLKRLMAQNEKLHHEMEQMRGSMVPLAEIKQKVISANHTVKRHLLALPDRLAPQLVALDVHQIRTRLHREITSALNELAFTQGK